MLREAHCTTLKTLATMAVAISRPSLPRRTTKPRAAGRAGMVGGEARGASDAASGVTGVAVLGIARVVPSPGCRAIAGPPNLGPGSAKPGAPDAPGSCGHPSGAG